MTLLHILADFMLLHFAHIIIVDQQLSEDVEQGAT